MGGIYASAQVTNDSISINIDSLLMSDTLANREIDTTKTPKIKISKDAITEVINYSALDSNFTDVKNKEVHLYTKGDVKVEKVNLSADYIVFNFDQNMARAYEKKDSNSIVITKPSFTEGDNKGGFKEMQYNFKTKKGYVKQLTTEQSEFFIEGSKSKFVGKDSINIEDRMFQEDAMISTCNHSPAHFGIRATRMKMIPKKIAVMGPAQLEIAGIPTPIILPFGFFPLIKGRSSGLIFPRDYTFDKELGFGLQGIGYYFPINDNIDARVMTNLWTRGTHGVTIGANYNYRYKYTGLAEFNYNNQVRENEEGKNESQKSFSLRLSHNQDSKAHPYRNLSGSINIETNNNSRRNNYDFASQVNNKLYSNFNFTYRWPESPFSFRASLSHNQDNQTRVMNITLPDAGLSMNTIQPFKRKNSGGDQKWYENINVDGRAEMKNFVRTTDTALFTKATLNNIETGYKHGINVSTNTRVLKYFNVSPSASYEEVYFFKTLNKYLDPKVTSEPNGRVSYGTQKDTLLNDFEIFRRFTSGVSVQTALFAMKRFNKGWLRGIRHTMKPSISLAFTPQTQQTYQKYVDTDTRPSENNPQAYNPLSTGAFSQGLNIKTFSLNYDIANIFEMKYRGKKDTLDKKFNIFNGFNINGNYNFAADSFKWSDVRFNATADLVKGYSTIFINALFTPYKVNFAENRRTKELLIKSNDKKLLEMLSFDANISSNIPFTKIKEIFKAKKDAENGSASQNENAQSRNKYRQPFTTLLDRFNFSHSLSMAIEKTKMGNDSFTIRGNTLNITGSFPLTKNWDLSVGSVGYDFNAKSLTYPSFSLNRDLHCWAMRFSWFPQSGVYSFFIGVKSGAFNFLKYDYNQPFVPRL